MSDCLKHLLFWMVVVTGLTACGKEPQAKQGLHQPQATVLLPVLTAEQSKGQMDFAAYLSKAVIQGDPLGKLSPENRISIRLLFASIYSRLETLDKKDQFISVNLPIWKLLVANFPGLVDEKDLNQDGRVSLIKLGGWLSRLKE